MAHKPDSMEICFVPDGDYASYIEEAEGVKSEPGNFVDLQGHVLGRHRGIIHYTVGQRKGLNLALGYPAFVVRIKPETNEIVIGRLEDDLYECIFTEPQRAVTPGQALVLYDGSLVAGGGTIL